MARRIRGLQKVSRNADGGNVGESVGSVDTIGGAPLVDIGGDDGGTGGTGADAGGGGNDGDGGTGPAVPVPGKRGRPAGSRNRNRGAVPVDTTGLEKLLISIHAGIAAITHFDGAMIEPEEAKQLATAARDLQEHYPAVDIPAKALAWANLLGVAGAIYGPRVLAYRITRKRQPAAVVPLPRPEAAVQ